MSTAVHSITVVVIDHDDLGAPGVSAAIETARYDNHCIAPRVAATITKMVDWSDDHPLNTEGGFHAEWHRLFASDEKHEADAVVRSSQRAAISRLANVPDDEVSQLRSEVARLAEALRVDDDKISRLERERVRRDHLELDSKRCCEAVDRAMVAVVAERDRAVTELQCLHKDAATANRIAAATNSAMSEAVRMNKEYGCLRRLLAEELGIPDDGALAFVSAIRGLRKSTSKTEFEDAVEVREVSQLHTEVTRLNRALAAAIAERDQEVLNIRRSTSALADIANALGVGPDDLRRSLAEARSASLQLEERIRSIRELASENIATKT